MSRKRMDVVAHARGMAMVAALMVLITVVILILAAVTREKAAGAAETTASVAEETQVGEQDLCVAVDAGHGGLDPGSLGGEILEKDINLAVALKLKTKLEAQGVSVLLTRASDREVSLERRTNLANLKKADLFISLHCNEFVEDDQVAGLECYYQQDKTAGEQFAEQIFEAVQSDARIPSRNVKAEDYYVLRNTTMPAVLVELGFLSNAAECRRLNESEYQDLLAEKLAEGILRQLGVSASTRSSSSNTAFN